MKPRDLGMTLMAAGVACFMIYGLLNLSGSNRAYLKTGSALLFVGVIAVIAGLVRYMTAGSS